MGQHCADYSRFHAGKIQFCLNLGKGKLGCGVDRYPCACREEDMQRFDCGHSMTQRWPLRTRQSWRRRFWHWRREWHPIRSLPTFWDKSSSWRKWTNNGLRRRLLFLHGRHLGRWLLWSGYYYDLSYNNGGGNTGGGTGGTQPEPPTTGLHPKTEECNTLKKLWESSL